LNLGRRGSRARRTAFPLAAGKIARGHAATPYSGGIARPRWASVNRQEGQDAQGGADREGGQGGADREGAVFCPFPLQLFFLENMLDFAVTVIGLWHKLEGWARAGSGCTLTPLEFAEIYLAPLGKLPRVPFSISWLYLACGLRLARMTGNPDILRMMLFAVTARGNIVTQSTIDRFRKELIDMETDIVQCADALTGGQYSANLAYIETLAEDNKSKDAAIKSKDAAIESKDAENETLKRENKRNMSVVKMRHANKTPEEISAELNLEMPEVVRILQDFGIAG
jgi:hypothetical protein